MIHVRFTKSPVFHKRKDVDNDEQGELVFAIPDECKFHFTYETLRVDTLVLAGWDQHRGAWFVPVVQEDGGEWIPALGLDSDMFEHEFRFSDMEIFVP